MSTSDERAPGDGQSAPEPATAAADRDAKRPAPAKPQDSREERLAAALRANLRKRKAASRPGTK